MSRLEALERQFGSLDLSAELTPIRAVDALWLVRLARAATTYVERLDNFRAGDRDIRVLHDAEDDLRGRVRYGR